MNQLHVLSVAEQLRALHGGEVSSRELTQHYLDRITKLDAELGAFITVDPELALHEADRADEQLARHEQAPLGGIPVGIKDLTPTAGLATSFGSAALAGQAPANDTWTVGLIRRAGAVVLGKTNTPEFGATCYTENAVSPLPSVTPFDTGRYSSGSSGGAATAVSAGLLPVAHGSDGAGSIRTPAATCHLVGVKPTRGLVSPAPGTGYFAPGIEGPLARTVEDAALLLEVMAQPWAGDIYGWTPGTSLAQASRNRPDRTLKVAWWTGTGIEGVDPHPEAARAVHRTVELLRGLGHDVREIDPPASYDETATQAFKDLFSSSVALSVPMLMPADKRELLTPYTQHLLARGEAMSGTDVLLLQTALARLASAYLARLDDFDIALTPTTSGPPVPLGHFEAEGIEQISDRMLAWSCYTPWANLTGQPAVSLPSHLDDEGLPYGIQLVAHLREDASLLSLAGQLEREGLWNAVHPPHWYR